MSTTKYNTSEVKHVNFNNLPSLDIETFTTSDKKKYVTRTNDQKTIDAARMFDKTIRQCDRSMEDIVGGPDRWDHLLYKKNKKAIKADKKNRTLAKNTSDNSKLGGKTKRKHTKRKNTKRKNTKRKNTKRKY